VIKSQGSAPTRWTAPGGRTTSSTAPRGRRSSRLAALLLSTGVLLAACGGNGEGGEQEDVAAQPQPTDAGQELTQAKFNVYQGTPYTWLVVLTECLGTFEEHGIDAQLVPTDSGPTAIAGLVSGDLQFVSGDVINGGIPVAKGIDLKIVSGMMLGKQQLLVARKEANLPDTFPENVQALEGQPFGIVSPGSATNFYANMILDAAGMKDTDVRYAPTTALPANIAAALESGRVSAAMGALPVVYGLVNSGDYEVVFNLDTVTSELFEGDVPSPDDLPADAPLREMADLVHQYLWTTEAYASENEEVITQVQEALAETDVFLRDPENVQEGIDCLLENEHVTEVPGATEEETRRLLEVTLPLLVAHAPADDINTYQEVWTEAGVLPKALPVDEVILDSVPQSPEDVAELVEE
jgi:ABC-type nitrate/sulfonate/bicarbonate transport system substrate-binding protein